MAPLTIEQRLAHLESQVAELQGELRAARHSPKDWRRTIGAFTDDPALQEILAEAMKLREADRAIARNRRAKGGAAD
jgi:predicted  nucleic acid-binding Zn-ribbon protein